MEQSNMNYQESVSFIPVKDYIQDIDKQLLTELLTFERNILALPPHFEYKAIDGLKLCNCAYKMFACKKEDEAAIIQLIKTKKKHYYPFDISEVIAAGHVKELTKADIDDYFPILWAHRLKKVNYGFLTAYQVFRARLKEIGFPEYIVITKTSFKPKDLIDDREPTKW